MIRKTKKYDNIWLGLGSAVVLTILSFFGFYLSNQAEFGSLSRFLTALQLTEMFSSVVSLSALPNLLLFFVFIWTKRNRSAKGVLTAVMLITIMVAYLRLG